MIPAADPDATSFRPRHRPEDRSGAGCVRDRHGSIGQPWRVRAPAQRDRLCDQPHRFLQRIGGEGLADTAAFFFGLIQIVTAMGVMGKIKMPGWVSYTDGPDGSPSHSPYRWPSLPLCPRIRGYSVRVLVHPSSAASSSAHSSARC